MKKLVNIREVKPNADNPRIIKDHKFKKLVKSIKEFPQMLEKRPIVVDENMIVLGGNMRLKALLEAGIQEVWIDIAENWSEEQKKEFIIKDNVGFGEWDWDILANEWEPDLLEDWGLDLPDMFDEPEPEAAEDDYEEPDNLRVDVVKGDLIEIGEHRLLCGDSTNSDDVAKLMNGEKANMVHTDPPYGIDYNKKNEHLNKATSGKRITHYMEADDTKDFYAFASDFIKNFPLADYNTIYIWINGKNVHPLWQAMTDNKLYVATHLTWVKNNHSLTRQDYHAKTEICLYGWQNKHKFYGGFSTDVLEFNRPHKNTVHPTMKPIDLVSKLLTDGSQQNDLVLDLFLGSGSTMVAAHQLNRKCYGMELDPKYCQVVIDRMQKLDSNLEIKINGQIYGQN